MCRVLLTSFWVVDACSNLGGSEGPGSDSIYWTVFAGSVS